MASRPPAPKAVPQDTTDEFAVGGEGSAGEEKEEERGASRDFDASSSSSPSSISIFFLTFQHTHQNKTKNSTAPAATTRAVARETDPRRLEQRQKQIDFGKNTRGYQRYAAAVPR